jgi:hypothetical protein
VGLQNECHSSVLKAFSFYFRSVLSMAAWGTREPPKNEKKKIIFISRKSDPEHRVGRVLQNEVDVCLSCYIPIILVIYFNIKSLISLI